MVNITDLLIACTQAPGETGPITLVTFCVLIVTENGSSRIECHNNSAEQRDHCIGKIVYHVVSHLRSSEMHVTGFLSRILLWAVKNTNERNYVMCR